MTYNTVLVRATARGFPKMLDLLKIETVGPFCSLILYSPQGYS